MEASLSSFYSNNNGANHLDERANSSDNSGDNSPSTTNFTSMSSPKRSRRALQKKVITIPIKDLEGSKFKSDCTPPSDSWAWRKYGQKPIKGSPYPRGYYRCSSSKGCPARKQVERSRLDPTMLVVTYSYDHNHPWPSNSRNHHHQNRANNNNNNITTTIATSTTSTELITTKTPTIANTNSKIILNNNQFKNVQQNNNNNNINISANNNVNVNINMDYLHQPLIPPIDELTWLSSDNEILQNDFMFNNNNFINDLDMSKLFPIRSDEDDSLFADLGELPECPVMFRTTVTVAGDDQHHPTQCGLTPWCGSIS